MMLARVIFVQIFTIQNQRIDELIDTVITVRDRNSIPVLYLCTLDTLFYRHVSWFPSRMELQILWIPRW